MASDPKLDILIDVRSRLDDLVKAQNELRKLGQEANSAGHALETGLGIDIAHRGIDILKESLEEAALKSFELAEQVKNGAQNLGLSTDAYQVLGRAIREAGGDMSLLNQAVTQNNRSLNEGRTYGSAAAGAFRQLGLSVAELDALPVELRFEAYGRAILASKDKTAAFAATSQILGSRNLPTLISVLKEVAAGYDEMAAKQKAAGLIMEGETIVRLERAKKELETFKDRWTVTAGEVIGGAFKIGEAIKKALGDLPFAIAGSVLNPGSTGKLFGQVWTDLTKTPAQSDDKKTDDGSAARLIALTEAQTKAEYDLAAAALHRQTIESDPNVTGLSVQARQLDQMQIELRLREKLIAASKAMPFGGTGEPTKEQHDLAIKKLEEQNQQLRDQIKHLNNSNQFNDAGQASQDKFDQFRTDQVGDTGGIGGGIKSGAQDWVTGLGSQGQQAATALQTTLGSTVSGITDGILGWINHTQSFGASMAQLGGTVFRTFLNTIIQMGVQWLVTQGIIKTGMLTSHILGTTLRAERTAGAVTEGATTTAAMAPAAAATSISSFGAAAIIGIALLVAAMAMFGGFSSGGYTGNMGTDQVAGVVHGQEHVMTAATTRRLGPAFFDRLNAGGSPASSVAGSPAAFGGGGGAGSGSVDSPRNTHIYLDRSAWLDSVRNDLTGIAHQVYDQRSRG